MSSSRSECRSVAPKIPATSKSTVRTKLPLTVSGRLQPRPRNTKKASLPRRKLSFLSTLFLQILYNAIASPQPHCLLFRVNVNCEPPLTSHGGAMPHHRGSMNQKGGVGKTTTTVNLGRPWPGMGQSVLPARSRPPIPPHHQLRHRARRRQTQPLRRPRRRNAPERRAPQALRQNR